MPRNEVRFVDGKMVERFQIIGTKIVVYRAWEPIGEGLNIRLVGDKVYHAMASNYDRAKFEHLPGLTNERIRAFSQAEQEAHQRAYDTIFKAFPGLKDIKVIMRDGDIEVMAG